MAPRDPLGDPDDARHCEAHGRPWPCLECQAEAAIERWESQFEQTGGMGHGITR